MSWFEWLLLVVALLTLAGIVGIAVRIRQPDNPKQNVTYNGPILPKTYNDRYPKRSAMLVNNPPVEGLGPETKVSPSPSQEREEL